MSINKNIPLSLGWLLIPLSAPLFLVIGLNLLMSSWGLCGDGPGCNPSVRDIFEVVSIDAIMVLIGLSMILVIYSNFRLSRILKNNSAMVIPASYFIITIAAFLLNILIGIYVVLPYQIRREIDMLSTFGALSVFIIVIFTFSIYFIRKTRN